MSDVHKRAARTGRIVRRELAAKTVAEAVGEIGHGCEIFGLSKGQFSLVDIIEHCLETTGPADVVISTWTAAGADIDFANALLVSGAIKSLRMVVDFSFPTRQPAYCAALRERFGDEALRVTKTHAKFVTIRNDEWAIVIRSSMNLNENRRLESFEISDDAGMADYLADVVDELFASHAPGSQFKKGAYENAKDFELLGERSASKDLDAAALAGDRGKYFGTGPVATDLRRAGWVTSKGQKL